MIGAAVSPRRRRSPRWRIPGRPTRRGASLTPRTASGCLPPLRCGLAILGRLGRQGSTSAITGSTPNWVAVLQLQWDCTRCATATAPRQKPGRRVPDCPGGLGVGTLRPSGPCNRPSRTAAWLAPGQPNRRGVSSFTRGGGHSRTTWRITRTTSSTLAAPPSWESRAAVSAQWRR
jgi:hypothetical protein